MADHIHEGVIFPVPWIALEICRVAIACQLGHVKVRVRWDGHAGFGCSGDWRRRDWTTDREEKNEGFRLRIRSELAVDVQRKAKKGSLVLETSDEVKNWRLLSGFSVVDGDVGRDGGEEGHFSTISK